jgi:hypothetical protein
VPKDFEIYSTGIVYCSVCSSLGLEETLSRVNLEDPTRAGWELAPEPFRTGEPNPHPCENHPTTHKHYLFQC